MSADAKAISRNSPAVASTSPGNGAPLHSTITPALRAIITMTVMIASVMEVLDTSIVNVALPDMMGNLGATLDQIGWVSTGYIIANVILLPLTGWLSDYFGRKMYLFYSVLLFTIASFFCGTSHSLNELILWRVIQGAGGAAFLSTAQATLLEIFPPNKRAVAQAIFGLGIVVAPTLGPTVGGFLTSRFSWPWIFWVNIPLGIICAVNILLYVPNSPNAGAKRSADFLGILLLAIGLGSLQAVLERGESEDWFETRYIVLLAVTAIVGMISFVWWQKHPSNKNPAVDLSVLKNRNLLSGTIVALSLGFGLYGSVFLIPQFLQSVQSHTAEQAGLLLIPGGLMTAAMMPIVGKFGNKTDLRLFIAAGIVLFGVGMLDFSWLTTSNSPDEALLIPLLLRGAGIGLQIVPLSLVTLGTLKPNQISQGAGLYNLFRQLGGSFGIAIIATILDRRQHFHFTVLSERASLYNPLTQERLVQIQNGLMSKGMSATDAKLAAMKALGNTIRGQSYVLAFNDAFFMMGVIMLAGLFLILLLKKAKPRQGGGGEAH